MNGRKNSGREYRIRFGIIMLALIMAVTMMPAFAFAQTEPTPDSEPIGNICNEGVDKEAEELESVTTEEELPNEAELLQGYLDEKVASCTVKPEAGGLKLKSRNVTRRSVLTEAEQEAYDRIKPYIERIASGSMTAAKFIVPHKEGIDYKKVVSALMIDMPYEFYWYDKVEGYLHGRTKSGHIFYFSVSPDYWNTAVRYEKYNLIYGLDYTKTRQTNDAVNNVSDIINELSDANDINKLLAYRNIICEFVDYDKTAAAMVNNSGGLPFYGDPWQLIYVFDYDDSTDVVCEGYSKAFQYLCDKSTFSDSSIECYTVTGDLYNGTIDLGGHMWNILHMEDGRNYIADITNSDMGSTVRENLFLRGYSTGNEIDGYRYPPLNYIYDDETKRLYGDELTLSDTDYSIDSIEIVYHPAREATCTSAGGIERWLMYGWYYSAEDCSPEKRIKYAEACPKRLRHDWSEWKSVRKPSCTAEGEEEHICSRCGYVEGRIITSLGHSWSGWKTVKAATCTAKGSAERKCSTCGAVSEKVLPALGHSWKVKDTLDKKCYSCSRCGSKKTISKVVVDRPKVTIKKPARAKKGFTVKWKELSRKKLKKISGIEIQYSTKKNFASDYKIRKAKKTAVSKKITKLKRKKTYYVRIRTYKMINGKKHVSKWSKVRKVKTK